MIYEIERVRTKNGDVTDRETRRKGHRVQIEFLELSMPLFYRYVDGGGLVKTSAVEAYNAEYKTQNHLSVQTRNSVYFFRKVSDE